VNTGEPDPAMPVDHPPLPPLELGSKSSQAQRLTVQQLRLTYPAVLGADAAGKPITWRLGDGRAGLDVMARPMGEPDYVFTTDEVLEPSPLYTKFVDDAARNVCDQALKADATAAPGKRVLTRKCDPMKDTLQSNPQAVRDNLRYLKLRLHGVKIAATYDAAVARLATLFDEAAKGAKGSTSEGWRTVCVALLTDAEFHTY